MPTEFYIFVFAVGFALVVAGGIAIAAAKGSRREKVREREGRRDGYVRDGDDPDLFEQFRIDDCPRGRQ